MSLKKKGGQERQRAGGAVNQKTSEDHATRKRPGNKAEQVDEMKLQALKLQTEELDCMPIKRRSTKVDL